jgi:hypothetical protein
MVVDIYLYDKIHNECLILLSFKLKNSHLFASFFDLHELLLLKASIF